MPVEAHARSRRSRSVAIVGGGLGGVGAAAQLIRAGYEDVTVFERSERLGGVWNANTYPGAACDVPSHLYEFSFHPNPDWTRKFAPQEEIRGYVDAVADAYGVRSRVRTGVEVTRAAWDDGRAVWVLETNEGVHEAAILLPACGQLTTPQIPNLPGTDTFEGDTFHTAQWRHDVDLTGKRVVVVGSGCSAVQVVPAIQPRVAQLTVFQRSPGWTLPKKDRAYSDRARNRFSRFPVIQRLHRAWLSLYMDVGALAMTRSRWLLAPFRVEGRHHIRRGIKDPALRKAVTPSEELGCKRIMLSDDWYPALAEPNVELVTSAVTGLTRRGVLDADGREHEAEVVVWATGFRAHDFVAPMEIVGAGGRRLRDAWADVPRAYLGLSVPDFPNMFLIYGPNTNGGTGSVVVTIESNLRHVTAALRELDRRVADRVEVARPVADTFDGELRAALQDTVWHTGCENWYLDAQGNNPNQWPWLLSTYRRRTSKLEPGAYVFSCATAAVQGAA
jgi:cation diffusion facilitator CzcD-associated flavoprotein CzcO